MSILSMTGFGAASLPSISGTLTAELRSVNSRFLELSIKTSDELRVFEPLLRELITRAVLRGKVELRLSLQRTEGAELLTVNEIRLQQLLRIGARIQSDAEGAVQPWAMADLLRWPGVLALSQGNTMNDGLDEPCEQVVLLALESFVSSRMREGARLTEVILQRLDDITRLAGEAVIELPSAMEAVRHRLQSRLSEAVHGLGPQELQETLMERIRQEAHAAALRADISEELDRLGAHVSEMRSILRHPTEQSVGKRLDFVTQELHREANTLGSKSASLSLTNIAMSLKLTIEQIREQVQNVQ